jgi:hypothetical protein
MRNFIRKKKANEKLVRCRTAEQFAMYPFSGLLQYNPLLKLNQIEPARSKPISKPISKNQYPTYTYIVFLKLCLYERYPSHRCADADHRRCRPNARSPLSPSNLATVAARQSGAGIVRQSCGCSAGLSRQSGGRHKTVWRDRRRRIIVWHGHRKTVRQLSSETVKTVQQAPRDNPARPPPRAAKDCLAAPCLARRLQPSQQKPARHGRGCALWPSLPLTGHREEESPPITYVHARIHMYATYMYNLVGLYGYLHA